MLWREVSLIRIDPEFLSCPSCSLVTIPTELSLYISHLHLFLPVKKTLLMAGKVSFYRYMHTAKIIMLHFTVPRGNFIKPPQIKKKNLIFKIEFPTC